MKQFFLFPILVCVLMSCEENKTIEDIFTQGENHKISLSDNTVISTKMGAKITFLKGCFKDDGHANLYIEEYYSISDVLVGGLSTVSNNKILESSGMVFIEVKDKSGNHLDIIDDTKCIVEMPMPQKKGYNKLFYGDFKNGEMNWVEDTSKMNLSREPLIGVGVNEFGDKFYSGGDEFYPVVFNVSKLGWINADKFIETKETEDFIVENVEANPKYQYSLVLDEYNSVVTGYFDSKNRLRFDGIPKGESVIIVVLSGNEDEMKYSFTPMNTSNIDRLNQLKQVTAQELEKVFDKKFGKRLLASAD